MSVNASKPPLPLKSSFAVSDVQAFAAIPIEMNQAVSSQKQIEVTVVENQSLEEYDLLN